MPVVTIVVKFEVNNFMEWKKIIDANENMRKGLNITLKSVYVSTKNVDSLMVILEAESEEKFHNYFCNDPEIRKVIDEFRYINEPNIEFYNKLL
ncbi:hypothetical protein OX284_011540 [Flavobacterium sp. SUN046]|uniref:hypothetical protein n=1 Tax=Flavobacterium sp. SUN046 TaxID=3002440 RepID=UPI002DBB7DD6|nr:hypothetical protein [Flavobacterium sp. SUN046]MEC4050065.1 hypothetical protein [Flavobacterium sp. SUN046]